MTITDIKKTKRGRYSIFGDDEFLFSCDGETVIRFSIRVGKEMDENNLLELFEESQRVKCRSKGIVFLSMRLHSRKELQDKLGRAFEKDIVLDTLETLENTGLIDDESFSKILAQQCIDKSFSRSKTREALYKKGISKEIMEDVLDGFEFDESSAIKDIIDLRYINRMSTQKERDKVKNALIRKGFKYSDIDAVFRDMGFGRGYYD